jgi:peptidoglycan/xylan/chitin deacetylase (PgdA/CDA1 family)
MRYLVLLITVTGLALTACGPAGPGSVRTIGRPSPDPSLGHRPAPRPSATPVPTPSHGPSPTPSHAPTPVPSPPDPSPDPSPAPGVPPSLAGTEWTRLPTSRKVVALTFDAGANDAAVPSILSTLAERDVPATFFLTGKWVQAYPAGARTIGSRYPVGNHTYSHPYLTGLDDAGVRYEIAHGGELIRSATGRDTRPMFRFPYGDSDHRTIGIANTLGYGGVRWTVDTLGWKGTAGGESVDRIVARVLAALQPGEIVLMHVGSVPQDGTTLDADALPRIIDEIRARGYEFVTIQQYLG